MQDRYVGDVGDFGKYGLLRSLCRGDEHGAAIPTVDDSGQVTVLGFEGSKALWEHHRTSGYINEQGQMQDSLRGGRFWTRASGYPMSSRIIGLVSQVSFVSSRAVCKSRTLINVASCARVMLSCRAPNSRPSGIASNTRQPIVLRSTTNLS